MLNMRFMLLIKITQLMHDFGWNETTDGMEKGMFNRDCCAKKRFPELYTDRVELQFLNETSINYLMISKQTDDHVEIEISSRWIHKLAFLRFHPLFHCFQVFI